MGEGCKRVLTMSRRILSENSSPSFVEQMVRTLVCLHSTLVLTILYRSFQRIISRSTGSQEYGGRSKTYLSM